MMLTKAAVCYMIYITHSRLYIIGNFVNFL